MMVLPGGDRSTRAGPLMLICALLGAPMIVYGYVAFRPGDPIVTVNGHAVAMGGGSAWAYLTLRDGVPVELGVALRPRAGVGLPEGRGLWDGGARDNARSDYRLGLPGRNPTPYRHIVVDWKPQAHELLAAPDQPLLALRFYTIGEAQRRRIDRADPAFEQRAARPVRADFIPPGYVMSGAAPTPHAGARWIDPDHARSPGDPFNAAVLYGSWDGRMILTEVLAAGQLLEGRSVYDAWLAPAAHHSPSGYYPTSLQIRWDVRQGVHRVALTGFVASD